MAKKQLSGAERRKRAHVAAAKVDENLGSATEGLTISDVELIVRRKQASPKTSGHQSNITTSASTNDDSNAFIPLDNKPSLYIIKKAPGKGLGIFALCNLQKGTRILTEEPLFSIEKSGTGNSVLAEISKLPTEVKHHLMQLHDPNIAGVPRPVRIFHANCFGTGSTSSIFLHATRMNHNCVPNCHYSWNTVLNRLTMHAVKDISKDQELTISYCENLRTREQRKASMAPAYNFVCECLACQPYTAFGRASDIRRQRMMELDQQIAGYNLFPKVASILHGHPDALPAALEIIDLLLEEGVVNGELWRTYNEAFRLYEARGLNAKALVYAGKKLEAQLYCLGTDSHLIQETMQDIQRLSKT